MTSLRRALIALGVVGFAVGTIPLTVALTSTAGHHRLLIAVFGPLIGWAFIGTGIIAWLRRPETRIGALMTAVGFTYCLSGLIVSTAPVLFTVGLLLLPMPYAILFHILLAFPSGELTTRFHRVLVWTVYLSAAVAHPLAVMFQNTERQGLPANVIMVADNRTVMSSIYWIRFVIGTVLVACLLALLVRRWRRFPQMHRRGLGPVFLSGGTVMALFGVWYVASIVEAFGAAATETLEKARVAALATVPFAFLVGLLRSRVAQAGAVSELVTRLGQESSRTRGLRDVLAETLGDPGLKLVYWLPARGEYVDASGLPVTPPAEGSGLMSTPIDNHGQRIGALIHDATLADERELVRAAGAAAALTLENERLDAELRAKVAELQASSARIVQSSDAARRKIERDLHDGAQQRLVTLALTLRLARAQIVANPQTAHDLLEQASGELDLALGELRELARGIHPAVLSERGLAAALQGLANRAKVPVEIAQLPSDGLPKPIEAAAYFVVAEGITNVVKYAQATQATVAVTHENGLVTVSVMDDGVGGADPANGSGLRGLADRVAALGGRLDVQSPEGSGTIVWAVIPCDS